jgi:hypothetical protein
MHQKAGDWRRMMRCTVKGIGKGGGDGYRGVKLVDASVTNGWDSKIP